MANRNFDTAWTLGKGIVNLDGSFDCNGASNPTRVIGLGWTVTHTATGEYTIQLQDLYPGLLSFDFGLQNPLSTSGNWAAPGTISGINYWQGTNTATVGTPQTFKVWTMNPGGTAAVDLAANAAQNVMAHFVLKNSVATP